MTTTIKSTTDIQSTLTIEAKALKDRVIKRMNEVLEAVSPEYFEHIGEVIDLKMYEASNYAAFNDDIPYEWFMDWCELQYEHGYLVELSMKELKVEQYGRSNSSFYYIPLKSRLFNIYTIDEYKGMTAEERRLMVFEEYLYYFFGCKLDYSDDSKDGIIVALHEYDSNIETYEMTPQEALEELGLDTVFAEEFKANFEEFCCRELDDLNAMYRYVEGFKENQVECFKEQVEIFKENQEDLAI